METLQLAPREPMPDVENWDDDDDFAFGTSDLTFGSVTTASVSVPSRRGSHTSSHFSVRSDLDSSTSEEKQVHLPPDDEKATQDAVAVARRAGIPIPQNVPSSALMGGTIKRLGGRKIKKAMTEDWADDLVLPEPGQALRIKPQDASQFPDVLRQVSSGSTTSSPVKSVGMVGIPSSDSIRKSINLADFRDDDDDEDNDDLLGDGMETIKVSKSRLSKPISLISPPTHLDSNTPQPAQADDDDFESDFVLPADGNLSLNSKRDAPKTPSLGASEDFDWGEGSLGTRFAGTRRSARSSSASAMSPSVSSSITGGESEDDTFDGLVLPSGPLDLSQRLDRTRATRSQDRIIEEVEAEEQAKLSPVKSASPLKTSSAPKIDEEDMLDGLDLGDGDLFDCHKLTLNRNVKIKNARAHSPTRPKTTVSLTFTTKPVPSNVSSRLPRPTHERARSSLEPVAEGGEMPTLLHSKRSVSQLRGHSAQSSTSSSMNAAPAPPAVPAYVPGTPSRRLAPKTSQANLRAGIDRPMHTTNAQLLRLKRSCPVMNSPASKQHIGRYERPASRTDHAGFMGLDRRPRSPLEQRRTADHSRKAAPFIPAGIPASKAQNLAGRKYMRGEFHTGADRPGSRAMSRSTMRSPSPRRGSRILPDGTWRQPLRPTRLRHFGDGHELDAFDDLPVSREAEAKFLRQPTTSGPKLALRNRQLQGLPDRNVTPSPLTPFTPTYAGRSDTTPHFARDTAASRIAREVSLAQRGAPGGPTIPPLTTPRVTQLANRSTNFTPQVPQNTIRSKKSKKRPPTKPLLISNLNSHKQSKVVNGMYYNAETFRWEGNENVLNIFDPPVSSPSTKSTSLRLRDKENATHRVGLITNINATKGVQVVGQMVFDPQNMCWLKISSSGAQANKEIADLDGSDGDDDDDDDDDVFRDIPDLVDEAGSETNKEGQSRLTDIKDEWPVGEEFDVGPEFVRRQREEEERWRKKCQKWLAPSGAPTRDIVSWRWSIRDIINMN